MADVVTPNLGLTLPTVGADNNTWGGLINGDLLIIDPLWANIGNNPFGAASLKPLTFFAQAANNLSDLTNVTTARANLGLGSAAIYNTAAGGVGIPLVNVANTWPGVQTFSNGIVANVTGNCSGSSSSCTGNAATATNANNANACSGNAASASTAAACSGNSATATWSTNSQGMQSNSGVTANSVYWNGSGWVFNVGGVAVGIINSAGFVNLV